MCAVLAMVVGFVWYGPLFGKVWLRLADVKPNDIKKRQEMQKAAGPLYGVQFVLTFLEALVLDNFIGATTDVKVGLTVSLLVWLGFVVPTLAGTIMWTAEDGQRKKVRFLLQLGYQLVIFLIFGMVLMWWN
jgi:hypothetical protein